MLRKVLLLNINFLFKYMPGFLIHSALALILAIAVGIYLNLSVQKFILLILISLFSSLFPDVDIKTSIFRISIEKIITLLSSIILILFLLIKIDIKFVWLVFLMQLFLLCLYFIKHRGIFHNPFFAIILFLIFYLSFNDILFGIIAAVSFLLHLLVDRISI